MTDTTREYNDDAPFTPWPKIHRLNSGGVIVTEKIDGTNALVYVAQSGLVRAGSRTRWITPDQDNFGFARWVADRVDELRGLGPGYHYGEWWGFGIQRGYGCPPGERHFSLFNTLRWNPNNAPPACCRVVPVIGAGGWSDVDVCIQRLRDEGSLAMPGYRNPEGVVALHTASRTPYKVVISGEAGRKAVG